MPSRSVDHPFTFNISIMGQSLGLQIVQSRFYGFASGPKAVFCMLEGLRFVRCYLRFV